MWKSDFGTVLSSAMSRGSKDIFRAVLVALEDKLTPAEVIVKGFASLAVPDTFYGVAR